MENSNQINEKIGKNIAYYRKTLGLTQAELAEKINYSDKSVSKWESGNGAPDVYILLQLAELFNVTVNDLVGDNTPKKAKNISKGLHIFIMLLSCGMVWLVAMGLFVAMLLWKPGYSWWLVFLYAVWASLILLLVYACVWKYRILNFIATSLLIWVSLVCLHLTVNEGAKLVGEYFSGIWVVYLLGIPLQVLEVLWSFFRYVKKRKPKKTKKSVKKEE